MWPSLLCRNPLCRRRSTVHWIRPVGFRRPIAPPRLRIPDCQFPPRVVAVVVVVGLVLVVAEVGRVDVPTELRMQPDRTGIRGLLSEVDYVLQYLVVLIYFCVMQSDCLVCVLIVEWGFQTCHRSRVALGLPLPFVAVRAGQCNAAVPPPHWVVWAAGLHFWSLTSLLFFLLERGVS